jgi:FkbM family methyltransferase
MSLKSSLGNIAKQIAPAYYWNRKLNYMRRNFSEVEMKLLPFLCNKGKTSIDIGAAGGAFSINMLDNSSNVIGFEPIPDDAALLRKMFDSTGSNVKIEPYALSDKSGETILRMIANDFGRSTIEESNVLDDDTGSEKVGIKVPIRRLDDFKFQHIGFIKIDVEGHELAVLHGARELIKSNMPNFLIEIEDRHKENAVADVPAFLSEFGYQCYFVIKGKICPISEFDKKIHQDSRNIGTYTDGYERKGVYINNFIFVPGHEAQQFLKKAASISLDWKR